MPSIQAQIIEGGIGDVILLPGASPMSITSPIEQLASGVNPPNWAYRGGYRWKATGSPATYSQNTDTVHWSGWDPAWQDVIGYRGQTVVESPDGHWNQLVVIANGNTFAIYLNGTKVNEASNVVPSEGKLQIEVEFAEFYVRRWELKPLGSAPGPVITVDQLSSGAVGTAYSQVVSAAGSAPLTWSIASGSLPAGLSLNPASGQITGTPTSGGTSSFTVRVTDSVGAQATQPFQVAVSAPTGTLVANGLVLHLDSTVGVTATGNTVTAWADQSGSANNVTAVGNPQKGVVPTPSGMQSIRVDGVDDVLQRTATLTNFPGGNTDRTIFLVTKYNSTTWWGGVAYGTAATNQSFGLNVKHPTGELVLHGYGSGNDLVSSTPGVGAGWMIQSAVVSGGTATHFKDGVQIGQFAHTYNTALSKLVIGAEIGNVGYVGMDVAAVLLYNRALSPAERADVQAYLQGRFMAADTTPPVITVPASVTAEATGSSGAIVNFTTSAVDNVSGSVPTTNTPASGSLFPLGMTTVTTTATDGAGNTASSSFVVTVRDTTPPVVTVPPNMNVQAQNGSGAIVNFTTSATDTVSGSVATTSSPPSGSLFPVGTTTVTTTATDAAGNTGSATFTVTVSLTPGSGSTLITSGLVLYLDSTDGVATSGTNVTSWSDLSGNGNHLTPGGNPQKGTVFTPTGLPAIRLDGVDDKLQRTSGITGLPTGNAARTMFTVVKYNSATGWAGIAYGTGTNNQAFGLYISYPEGKLGLHAWGAGNDLISTTQGIGAGWLVQAGIVTGGNGTLFKDGTQIGQFAHSYNTVLGKIVVGEEIAGFGFVGADVAAVLVYNRALSDTERADVNAYLRSKYIVDTTPPVVTVPADITVEATSASGATVAFTTSATDIVSGNVPTTNVPPSGSVFPIGTSSVTATAVDAAGNSTARTFMITVRDTTAPVITVPNPGPLTHQAGSAFVDPGATATDAVAGVVPLTSSTPVNGFVPGTYTLTYNFTDAAGNAAMQKTVTVHVVDTIPPVITVPANITAEATSAGGATVTFSTSATDIVSGSVLTANSPPSGSVFPLGVTTVNVTATDGAGNTANSSFTVTVRDTTAPVITVPNPGPLTHEAGVAFVDPGATATDAVAGVVPLTSSTPVNGLVPGDYTLTYNFTDAAGNAAVQRTVVVLVRDTVGPVITVPANIIAEATSAAGATVTFSTSATDLVSGNAPTTNSPASGSVFPLGVTTVNVTATDGAGNTANRTFTVTVRDTTAPVITVPNPGPLAHEAGSPFIDPGATATDAVAGVVPLISSTPVNGLVPGDYTLTYNFTDAAGNAAAQKTVTVHVRDTIAPVITIPANIIAEATSAGGAVVTFSTSATDVVSGNVATVNAPPSGSVFPLGVTTVNVTATDGAGNTAGSSFTVTVRDTTAPVITVPNPGPLAHEAGTPFVDPGATASDAIAGVVPLTSSTPVNGLVPGDYTLTYNFTDAAGNAAAQTTVLVQVRDTVGPVITVPADIIAEATGPGGAIVNFSTSATDLVSGSVATSNTPPSGSLFPIGTTTVTTTATDGATNSASANFTVTVRDTTAPVITVPNPGPLTHEAGVAFVDPGATATDAVAGVVPLSSSTPVNGLIPGTYTLTYNFSDAAGNAATQKTVTVQVVDTTAPVITVPNPGPLMHEAGVAFIDPGATATDAVAGVVPLTSSTPVNGLIPGNYTLTYNFSDPSGNAATQKTVTVQVVDTTAPVITVPNPGPLTHEAGVAFVDPGATATDAVAGVVPLTSSTSVNGLVPGTYTLTYNFSDPSGNAATQKTVTVHVVDTAGPVITIPANIIAEATSASGATVTFTTSASDLISGPAATMSTPASGSVFPIGVTTVTTTATDASGNVASRTFTVTVRDTTPPVITVPYPGPLAHEAGTPFPDPGATATDVVAGVVPLTSSTFVNGLVPGDYALTYNFSDAAGNAAAQVTVVVNVVDTQTTVPGVVSYQGRIAAGGINFDGTGLFKFALVNGAGTTSYWSNDATSIAGSQPVNAVPLQVVNGLYTLRLGDTSLPNMRFIPSTAFGTADVHLRIWFNDGVNGWHQLSPDQRISATGYAMRANSSATVDAGGITAQKFAPGAVLANLTAANQAGVPSGGVILSVREDPALENAGYVKIATTITDASWQALAWQERDEQITGTSPAARFFHMAVWTGTEMIVWGGRNDGAFFNDGARYNSSTNTWTPVSTISAPEARCMHSGVWTGTEMIVWGGLNPGGTPEDVGRYIPATDTWTFGSVVNAPAGRVQHSAIWTGTEFIVWGGSDCDGNALNDGARYNPVTDTWTPLAAAGAPAPRRNHTAVWTGTRMIVWGGNVSPVWFQDGASYDPVSDTWTPLSAAGAPAARSHHTAVWTGSKMLVWGGHAESGSFADVGLYDPAGDTWTAGSTANAPFGRDFHTGVWTGSELFVWGGYNGTGVVNTGARFNPASNTWSPLDNIGAPTGRWLHTGVFAGDEVIVFGGLGGNEAPLFNEMRFFGPVRTVFVYQRP
jgi:N-acetylneuraminic acid mutarotase